jgi:predicted dehydrogenase
VGIAVVGCGHRPHAWSYARALSASSTASLVGVFDDDEGLGEPIAHEFRAPFYADAASLIGLPEVRGVVVCSASAEHRSLVELAASLGRHVFCEKPLATTLQDANAMAQSCRDGGVQLHTAFVSRFQPHVQRVRALLRAGEIGELLGVVAGNRGRPPLPPHYPDWITNPALSGGGALLDHSVHLSDVVRHLSGAEVIRVSAEVGAQLWDCGVDDVALLSLVFDSGLVASLDPSWSVPVGNPWDYDFFLRLVGTTGSLDINELSESLHLVSNDTGDRLRLVPFGEDVDALMLDAFVSSIRVGKVLDPCATGEDGIRALEIALAGYASAAARSPIDVVPSWRRSQAPTADR